jgi:ribosomal protein S18 acetylase RimI-like enzyme
MISLKIEPVVQTEYAGLADLSKRTYTDAFAHLMSPDDLQRIVDQSRSEAYFERTAGVNSILVAKYAGRIIGYTEFGIVGTPEVKATELDRQLHRLYVDTALHGMGIGRRLLEAALAEPGMAAAPNIFLTVWEGNTNALALYRSYGFVDDGFTYFKLDSDYKRDLIMKRPQVDLGTN